mgnify:CR=1 FL=1
MAKIVIIGDKEVDLKFLKIILVNQGHEEIGRAHV